MRHSELCFFEFQVAWIKSDTKAILAIHTHLVAQNPRLSVTHNGHNTWKLHVSNVQKNDSGTYMCQINTDPMRSQVNDIKEHLYMTKKAKIYRETSKHNFLRI